MSDNPDTEDIREAFFAELDRMDLIDIVEYDDQPEDPEPISWSDAYDQFDEFIRESEMQRLPHGIVSVMGHNFDPCRVLREVDPEAYMQEFLNWCDLMNYDSDTFTGYDYDPRTHNQ